MSAHIFSYTLLGEALQRANDVADEYQKAGRSWDATRTRLTAERNEARATIERVRVLCDSYADYLDTSEVLTALKTRDKADAAMEGTG